MDFPGLYHPSTTVGPLDYFVCPYRTVVDRFSLVFQHLRVHVKGSIGESSLWVCPYFSSSVPHVLLVLFEWF